MSLTPFTIFKGKIRGQTLFFRVAHLGISGQIMGSMPGMTNRIPEKSGRYYSGMLQASSVTSSP